jgi:undecaprenyl-diphosphatase
VEWWQAVVLGLVEGLTEYLPVSSTGHLLLAERLLGMPSSEEANAYAICIQAGAILAVLVLYHHRVKQGVMGLFGRDPDGRQLTQNLVVAFFPAAIIGFLLDDLIEQHLFGLAPVAIAWIAGGAAILGLKPPIEGRPLEALTMRSAAIIGLAQCLAMWPGTSRSLVTILAGSLMGLSLPAAVEFSFLLGLVTLSAATGYSGLKHGAEVVAAYGVAMPLLGFVVAWGSAVLAVRWMVGWLQKHGMALFAGWRMVSALIAITLLALGRA